MKHPYRCEATRARYFPFSPIRRLIRSFRRNTAERASLLVALAPPLCRPLIIHNSPRIRVPEYNPCLRVCWCKVWFSCHEFIKCIITILPFVSLCLSVSSLSLSLCLSLFRLSLFRSLYIILSCIQLIALIFNALQNGIGFLTLDETTGGLFGGS